LSLQLERVNERVKQLRADFTRILMEKRLFLSPKEVDQMFERQGKVDVQKSVNLIRKQHESLELGRNLSA
jgi:hypothetical protein